MENNYLFYLFYSPGNTLDVLNRIRDEKAKGKLHVLYQEYQKKFGYNSNFILPYRENDINSSIIVLNNPDDVERIASTHVKKTPYLKPQLYDSIISTTSVEHWKDQRRDFQPAFSVNEKLVKLIPISEQRTKYSLRILEKNIDIETNTANNVDLFDFFLNETLAQLQLAMFGFSEKFEKETNTKIRESFRGENIIYAREYGFKVLKELQKANGPLSQAMMERESCLKSKREEFGNALTFSFAGHDTTANTLTWLMFEICRHSDVYEKLQCEIDKFWESKETDISLADFKKLPYMTRCIMETLRLWTAIPNGTSRELQKDEIITGINDKSVTVKKGQYVQIPNWTRHRNPNLWGDECDKFNPDREFKDDELWNDSVFASYNPNSDRFSPFTYGPRDCIGKNFSQIEMRIILLYLLRGFSFSLVPTQISKYSDSDISLNQATLGPRNINNTSLYEKRLGMYFNYKIRNKVVIHSNL